MQNGCRMGAECMCSFDLGPKNKGLFKEKSLYTVKDLQVLTDNIARPIELVQDVVGELLMRDGLVDQDKTRITHLD